MAIYKWTPVIMMTPMIMKHGLLLFLIPYVTTRLFDHYFESYFLWKHRQDKIINIREEFATKLSKPKSTRNITIDKLRRMELFKNIYNNLKRDEK
jgi:DNA primase catalytic subunit